MRTRAPLLLLPLAACGDPLVEGDWAGPPLLALDTVYVADDGVFDPVEVDALRLSLFWATAVTPPERPERGVEEPLQRDPERPGRFGLHALPPPEARLLERDGFSLALARVLAWDARRGRPASQSCPWTRSLVGGAEETVLAFRQGDPPDDPAPWLDRLLDDLPPEGLSLLEVVPRSSCVFAQDTCRFVCSRCPDLLRPAAAGDGPPRIRIHRAAGPGRFTPPCFP